MQTLIKKNQQLPLDLSVRAASGRDDFLIAPENQHAAAWIDRWPDWPVPVLFICGAAASGKTHLAAVWQEKSHAKFIRPDSLLKKSAIELSSEAEHLILDGVDPWLGMNEAEETLFHLYNLFKEQKRSLLMTSRMPPAQVDFAIADVASRLRGSPVATILPPDDSLLAAVLVKLFSDRQLNINDDILRYILPRMERSFAAARDLVEKADRLALSNKQKISVPLIREVFAGLYE